jgi:hypothetical protein
MGTSLKSKELRPSVVADEVMFKFNDFCSDPVILNGFYEEEIATFTPILEEPPPLKL